MQHAGLDAEGKSRAVLDAQAKEAFVREPEAVARFLDREAQIVRVIGVERFAIEHTQRADSAAPAICCQPMSGSVNSNERFFTRSG